MSRLFRDHTELLTDFLQFLPGGSLYGSPSEASKVLDNSYQLDNSGDVVNRQLEQLEDEKARAVAARDAHREEVEEEEQQIQVETIVVAHSAPTPQPSQDVSPMGLSARVFRFSNYPF